MENTTSDTEHDLPERFFQHILPNGLTLLCQRIPGMQSAAMTFLLPAGSARDPADAQGTANVLSDLILRGAGDRDSRQLTDHLDRLGLERSSSVGVYHARLSCAALAANVMESLGVYADIVRRPRLPAEGFESARDLSIQAIEGLEDDPRQKLLIALRARFLPDPLGRNPMGRIDDLRRLTRDACADHWRRTCHASEAILSIAGNIEFDRVRAEVERHFAGLPAGAPAELLLRPPARSIHHERQKSEQTHIGIAWPSVPETDEDYEAVRIAVDVLGGAASSRLFAEVRERRGLCYNVWAGFAGLKSLGGILAYAGTSNDRAQATLDCLIEQIHRMAAGITMAELERARISLKAGTILQGESTSARSATIAHDFHMRGRIRPLEEVIALLDRVTLEQVNDCLRRRSPERFTIVTVGPKPLKTPC